MDQGNSGFGAVLGSLVPLGVGGVLLYYGLPNDRAVKCGDSVMAPGDYCGPVAGTPIGGRSSNYAQIAAEQHAGSVPLAVFGTVLLAIGAIMLLAGLYGMFRNPDY
ncbi:hypothetical protein [Streptomyces sp. NPDC058613]|uniref:hypothetical protein n=1 Tax=unclassified Streptomyces TaxID=2593676 RepID=UPI00366188CF